MKNLWEKDRKTIFRELKQMYLDEGYSHKEAKRLAEQETNEIKDALSVNGNYTSSYSLINFYIRYYYCTVKSNDTIS